MTTATAPTMTPTGLDDHAQSLIDARLDTIERMLLGQVPRADRLAIVRDVESQIHDLLAERNPDDTDRDAVIAALGRLDPPEAYLPDAAGAAPRPPAAPAPAARARPTPTPAKPAGRPNLVAAKASGILGIVALASTFSLAAVLFLAHLGVGEAPLLILYFGSIPVGLLAGSLAIIFAAISKLPNAWAVAGLVTGLLGFMVSSGGLGFGILSQL